MDQRQSGQDVFEDFDRVAAVKQREIRCELELVVVAPPEIETEGVERSDPEFWRRVWSSRRQSLR